MFTIYLFVDESSEIKIELNVEVVLFAFLHQILRLSGEASLVLETPVLTTYIGFSKKYREYRTHSLQHF